MGTALGIIKQAWRNGKKITVLVPETRPLLQGSRLTALELQHEGIPFNIVTEGGLGWLYSSGRVTVTVVGADRIAANGDTANKVGTLLHAVLANRYDVPFIVAAPLSTFDTTAASGGDVPIELRDGQEVLSIGSTRIAPEAAEAVNPAFDVTPAPQIAAIVTETGVLRPPFDKAISALSF
jgi:methylthioribose-1-phosphate isomerase